MYIISKVHRVVRGLIQRHGSTTIKRRLWNSEFAGGHWNCLDETVEDCVYPVIEKYARHGSILDLGCGSGNTGTALQLAAYSSYTGVDISNVAIDKAKLATETHHRTDRNHYHISDILHYVPVDKHDVILFRDSLYYVPHKLIVATLAHYATYLQPGGVFVSRLFDTTGKYKLILDIVENNFDVIEKRFSEPRVCVIAFRPKS